MAIARLELVSYEESSPEPELDTPSISSLNQINRHLLNRHGDRELGGSITDPRRRWRTIQMVRTMLGEINKDDLEAMNIKFDGFTVDIPRAIIIYRKMMEERKDGEDI